LPVISHPLSQRKRFRQTIESSLPTDGPWSTGKPEMRPGKRLSPRTSLRLALPILAGAPRNAPTPAKAGLVSASVIGHRSGVPLRLRLRPLVAGGDGLAPRSRPPLAIRRPSTTIRQDRSRSQALRSRHRRPCRAPAGADSFLHSRPVAFAPLPHLRAVRSRSTPRVTLRRRWAADARSRCTARASVVSPNISYAR
jgi:hypothetical protein